MGLWLPEPKERMQQARSDSLPPKLAFRRERNGGRKGEKKRTFWYETKLTFVTESVINLP